MIEQELLAAIERVAPNPERARSDLDRIREITATIGTLDPELAAFAFGYGELLRLCVRQHPDLVGRSCRDALAQGPDGVCDTVRNLLQHESDDLPAHLRRIRNLAHGRIALAQGLGLWSPQDVWLALSLVAELLIDAALSAALARMSARYGHVERPDGQPASIVALGFGKLGVRELNFSSDVDLVFVCSHNHGMTTGGADGTTDARRYWEKVVHTTSRLLNEKTADGFVYRVDLRLRPGGQSGLLVPSGDAFVEYYPNWGATWDRIALLRARPVAGDLDFGRELLQQLEAFVFPRHLDFESIDAMRYLRDRIDREATRRGKGIIDLKHGDGGIRELEFLVQNLQIIFAGRTPTLKVRDTLGAIAALAKGGLMPDDIAGRLSEAYTFLRHVENTLQARDDRQSYILPLEEPQVSEFARAAGFRGAAPAAALTTELRHHMACVAHEFALLYKRDEDTPEVRPEIYDLLENDALDDDGRIALLRELGFERPEEALPWLTRLLCGPRATIYGSRTREQFEALLPRLLMELVRTANPDQALPLAVEFIHRVGGRSHLYALLKENPAVASALSALFAGSRHLSNLFIRNPEFLDTLVLRPHVTPMRSREELALQLDGQLAEVHDRRDVEQISDLLRRFRQQEILRIGFFDLNGELPLSSVQQQLSDLAAIILERVRRLAFDVLAPRFGFAEQDWLHLAPLALGKLGAGEMNYGSDLDLVFVAGPHERLPLETAIRVAQRIISLLQTQTREGKLYDVDMRLRPSGNQGLLVTTLRAFEQYQCHQAAIWERVALIKGRCVVGSIVDHALGGVRRRACFERPVTGSDIDEMLRIRGKLIAERSPAEPVKAAAGGTADIETILALFQLRFARDIPELDCQSPLATLARCGELAFPGADGLHELHQHLSWYRRLETRLHLVLDRPGSRLPDNQPQLRTLARAMELEGAARLQAELAGRQAQVADRFEELVTVLRAHLDH